MGKSEVFGGFARKLLYFLYGALILAFKSEATWPDHKACIGERCATPEVLFQYYPPLEGPKIAYGIMCYQRENHTVEQVFGQFQRLFEALYHPENTYTVHIDIKSDKELHLMVDSYLDWFENTVNIDPVSVSWAGITVVERTLALMQTALEFADDWSYFVNLGHEDYPAFNQNIMSQWLSQQPEGTNYIKCWDIEGHDFFGQWEHHERRVEIITIDDFTGSTADTTYKRTRDPLMGMKFYKSLQQTVLSREFTKYAVYGIESRRILLYLANSKAPDELFFPTALQSSPHLRTTATCDDTRHFSHWVRPGGSWHPEYLEIEHLHLILNTDKFFIRKINEKSKGLLDVLDELMKGSPLESLGDLILSSVLDKEKLAYVKDKNSAFSIIAGLNEYRDLKDQHQIYHFKLWVNEQRRKHQERQQKKLVLQEKTAA